MLTVTGNLADETAIARLYDGIASLWASIHIAGGFAAGPLREASLATLRQQIDMNFVSCLLCCRAAVKAMTTAKSGRIVNVAARPGLEWRTGAGMVAYTASKAAVAALTAALAEEVVKDGILVNAVAPSTMDTPANRQRHAESRFQPVAEGRRSRGHDSVSRLPGKPRHPRRHRAGLREILIARPQSRRRQFEQVPVGIAEVNALAAARPFGAAFDGDVRFRKPLLPCCKLIGGD